MLDNARVRKAASTVLDPVARALLRMHATPAGVTVAGSIGAVIVSVCLIARGVFLPAALLMLPLAGADALDGTMARISGTASRWGGFLDSTTDRITDGAIFASFAWWAFDADRRLAVAAIVALIAGFVTSYTRAKAESLGIECKVGVAERPERVGGIMTAAGLAGLGVPYVLPIALYLIALLSCVTVWQRASLVRRSLA